jgi:hypothetical protein
MIINKLLLIPDPLCPERFTYMKKCSPFALIDGWKLRAKTSASRDTQAKAKTAKKGRLQGKKIKKTIKA